MGFVWHFLIGPVLAFLPVRWRERLPYGKDLDWVRAGTASGIYEMLGAVVGLGYWYMYEMTRRIGEIVDLGESGKLGPGVNDNQVRGAALFLFYMSPLTLVLFYFFFEGAVRLCAGAFTETALGSLPLYVTERLVFWVRKPEEARVMERVKKHASLFAESLRERAMVARLEEVEDEVAYSARGGEEWLEIRASRRKQEWVAPKVVRVGDVYYRLEESWVGSGARPFCYRLRRLPAGVPGRSVIVYKVGG